MKKIFSVFMSLGAACALLASGTAPASAVVDGNRSDEAAVVQLWSRDYKATNRLCTGTHIGNGWITTAKHCITAVGLNTENSTVVWGSTSISWQDRQQFDGSTGKISRIVTHPDSKKDLALIHSEDLAKTGAPSMQIRSTRRAEDLRGKTCTAYGYGIWAEDIYTNESLPMGQRSAEMTITRATTSIANSTNSQIEANGSNGAYLNTGDSGGALVCDGQLAGVTVSLNTRTKSNTFMSISAPERRWISQTAGV